MCARWLDDCNCLPIELKQEMQINRLKVSTFSYELAKGEMLCHLVAYLQPESIDVYRIIPNPNCEKNKSKHNINMFLETCRSSHFDIKDSKFINFDDLYSRKLDSIIYSLNILSKCPASANRGFGGFFYSQDSNARTTSYNKLQEENEEAESDYCPIDFVLTATTEQESPVSFEHIRNHDHVIREIMETEEKNNIMLDCLQNDFLLPLSKTLSYDDQKCISLNIEYLIKFHQALYFKVKVQIFHKYFLSFNISKLKSSLNYRTKLIYKERFFLPCMFSAYKRSTCIRKVVPSK